jgi:hypothetical protein
MNKRQRKKARKKLLMRLGMKLPQINYSSDYSDFAIAFTNYIAANLDVPLYVLLKEKPK